MLIADGRPVRLVRDALPLRQHGVAENPLRAPVKNATLLLFATDPEVFNFVADAESVELRHVHEGVSEPLELWRDSRATLQAFLRHLDLDQS